ncbi:MAG: SulP family inorganic anion transporter [Thermomicrobiales bacterium]
MSRDAGHETTLRGMWRQEFAGYSRPRFTHDLRAGLTVAAAGLATAIVGGALIGALGGAPYQISGPTGAMSAVLIVVAQKHGERGLWLAGLMAGVVILLLGLFRLGRIINVIPAPVITGFTSGIAPVIFTGQIDNAFGIHTPRAR